MEFLQHLTDDQTALLGCFGALIAAMGMLSLSFHSNPENKQSEETKAAEQPAPQLSVSATENVEERRRAA